MALAGALYFGVAYWQFTTSYVWLPLVVPLLVQLPASFGTAVWWSYRDLAAQRERVRTALGYYVPRTVVAQSHRGNVDAGRRPAAVARHLPGDRRRELHVGGRAVAPGGAGGARQRLLSGGLPRREGPWRRNLRHGWRFDGCRVGQRQARCDRALARRASPRSRFSTPSRSSIERTPTSPLPTRVGLETGEMVLGNIGGEERYEYRAVGDIVNTASRIQGLNQLLGTRVLLSATTLAGVDLSARDVGTRSCCAASVFPCGCPRAHLGGGGCRLDGQSLAEFAAALAAFRLGDWQAAHDRLRRSRRSLPRRWPEPLLRRVEPLAAPGSAGELDRRGTYHGQIACVRTAGLCGSRRTPRARPGSRACEPAALRSR